MEAAWAGIIATALYTMLAQWRQGLQEAEHRGEQAQQVKDLNKRVDVLEQAIRTRKTIR